MILSNTMVIKCFIGFLRYRDWLKIPKMVLSRLVGKKRSSQAFRFQSPDRPIFATSSRTSTEDHRKGVAILGEIKRKNLGTLPTVTCFDGRIYTVWHEIFAGSNFCDFRDFSSYPQK